MKKAYWISTWMAVLLVIISALFLLNINQNAKAQQTTTQATYLNWEEAKDKPFLIGEITFSPGHLKEKHAQIKNCSQCHEAWQRTPAAKCQQCHTLEKQREIKKGSVRILHTNNQQLQCALCHTDHVGLKGKTTKFEHKVLDKNQLDSCDTCHGQEKAIKVNNLGKCQSCHQSEQDSWQKSFFQHGQAPAGPKEACVSCHQRDNTLHSATYRKVDCQACHTIKQWKPVKPKHESIVKKVESCYSCHQEQAKNHLNQPGYQQNCQKCHSTEGWKPAGAGLTAAIKGRQAECIACHSQKAEVHKAVAYGSDCQACHSERNWLEISFSHQGIKAGGCLDCHQQIPKSPHPQQKNDCASCHKPGQPNITNFDHTKLENRKAADCASCHIQQQSYHTLKQQPYPNTCAQCHTTVKWQVTKQIDHKLLSKSCTSCHEIPAEPKHQLKQSTCATCHTAPGSSWKLVENKHQTASNCETCHKAVTDQLHLSTKQVSCQSCHQFSTWQQTNFQHQASTVVTDLGCAVCHQKAKETGHLDQWLTDSYVDKECAQCHQTTTWIPAQFDHKAVENQACIKCHTVPSVSHKYISNNCLMCHSTSTWKVGVGK